MATDADAPESGGVCQAHTGHLSAGEARTGRSPEGVPARAVRGSDAPSPRDRGISPAARPAGSRSETLYVTRIAALEAQVAALEAEVAAKRRDLQHVIDRYERVLQGRDDYRGEPLVDVGASISNDDSGSDERSELDDGREFEDGSESGGIPESDADAGSSGADRSLDTDRTALDRLRALLR